MLGIRGATRVAMWEHGRSTAGERKDREGGKLCKARKQPGKRLLMGRGIRLQPASHNNFVGELGERNS